MIAFSIRKICADFEAELHALPIGFNIIYTAGAASSAPPDPLQFSVPFADEFVQMSAAF